MYKRPVEKILVPHLGRIYPYIPEWWAGQVWFWPNFLPWKYQVTLRPAFSGPWSLLPNGLILVSDPARGNSSWSEPTWDFAWLYLGNDFQMTVTARGDMSNTAHELQWEARLSALHTEIASAKSFSPFSTQFTAPGGYTEAEDLITGLPCDPPHIATLEADYATGGTPFPHPTGGGP